MARKSGLSIVANQPEAAEPAAEVTAPAVAASHKNPPAAPTPAPAKGAQPAPSRYAGQYHIGASYDDTDETVEAFRALAFKTRRKHKDLLLEAMALLVKHHDPFATK